MRVLASGRFTRNILLPGWILTFGLLFASAPPKGLTESVVLLVVGVIVLPALMLIGARMTRP